MPARTGGRGVTLGAALQCEKGGAPCFFALVLMKNTGALLLEYHVPSPKPSTNFREEMPMVAPLLALGPHGPRSGHIVIGSCSSRPLGPVLPSEISPKVKALWREAAVFTSRSSTVCQESLARTWHHSQPVSLADDRVPASGEAQLWEHLPGFLSCRQKAG